jgi:DNA topoisomerase-1
LIKNQTKNSHKLLNLKEKIKNLEEKPRRKIGKITLQESLELFKLPYYLGDFEAEKVESNVGRFGP